MDGEALAAILWLPRGGRYATAVQVIDPDRLLLDLLPHCTPSVETVDDLAPVAVRAVRSNARRHRHAAEH
jgi:hypothetical protein